MSEGGLVRLFFILIFSQLSQTVFAAEEPRFSQGHYPLSQTSTSDTVTYFNLLVPRLKTYTARAVPVSAKGQKDYANVVQAELIGEPIRDPEGKLHQKAIRFGFKGLNATTEYEFEMFEVGRSGKVDSNPVDSRRFATIPVSEQKPLKFVVASCFCDEMKYAEAAQGIWKNTLIQRPEAIFMLGDETYVDSFDYVSRDAVTEQDVVMRYFDSFSRNPLFRSYRVVPVFATWDDHDTGINDGNKDTPTIAIARKLFQALYGGPDIPGVVENGASDGVQKFVRLKGQNFVLLDNRSYRNTDKNDRYGHFGEQQERWMLEIMKSQVGPFHLMNGDMWGTPTVMKTDSKGNKRGITESVVGAHPVNYQNLMSSLNETSKTYVLYSGDIHFSQILEYGPDYSNYRNAPFRTWEITSSPAYSIIFEPKPGEEVMWPDYSRIVGVKDYNVNLVESQIIPEGLNIEVTSLGQHGQQFYQVETNLTRQSRLVSKTRKFLKRDFKVVDGKVKVAFFDFDDTVRTAPSGNVTAKNADDVYVLPGVGDRIARLVEEGYLVVGATNQGGVDLGYTTFEEAEKAALKTISEISKQNPKAQFHYFDMATGGAGDYYSKPNIGMGTHLEMLLKQQGLSVDWANSFMVGDAQYKKEQMTPRGSRGSDFSDTDRRFAENLGIRSIHPRDFFGWSADVQDAISKKDISTLEKFQIRSCRSAF